MPITLLTPNAHVMSNRGEPRSPISPGVQSQTPTMVPSTGGDADSINDPVPGWPRLAKTIAEHPELEAFPSFTDLCVKSLLYYQAELIALRKELHDEELKDYRVPMEEDSYLYSGNLNQLINDRDEAIENKRPPPQQWVVIEKIRTTLEKYNAALLQFSNVAALREADNCNIETLRHCVRNLPRGLSGDGAETWGNSCLPPADQKPLPALIWGLITGFFVCPDVERKPVENVFQEHLIVPRMGNKPDALTQWVAKSFIPFWDLLWTNHLSHVWRFILSLWPFRKQRTSNDDPEKRDSMSSSNGLASPPNNNATPPKRCNTDNFTVYSGPWIVRATSIITTVVACLLPIVAITVLSRIHSMGLILGLIAVFTAIFAVGLVLLSSTSSRVEIFTATAAFSAVMVVFVQNQATSQ